VVEFSKNKLKTYLEEDVEIYLRNRIEEIPEKKEPSIKSTIKPKIDPKSFMENIKAQAQAKIDAREVNVPKAIP
jgi:hypothetical protein